MGDPKYNPPLDPALAIWVETLDADAREFFEERAGIREHDGKQPRREAEIQAGHETREYLKRRPSN